MSATSIGAATLNGHRAHARILSKKNTPAPDAENKDLLTLVEVRRKLNWTQEDILFFIDRREIPVQRLANGAIALVSWKAIVEASMRPVTRRSL